MIKSPRCVEIRDFFYYTNNSTLKKINHKKFVVDLLTFVKYVPCKTRPLVTTTTATISSAAGACGVKT